MALIKISESMQNVTASLLSHPATTKLALSLGAIEYYRREVDELDNLIKLALDSMDTISHVGAKLSIYDFICRKDPANRQLVVIISEKGELMSAGCSLHSKHNFMAYLNMNKDQSRRPLWDTYSAPILNAF